MAKQLPPEEKRPEDNPIDPRTVNSALIEEYNKHRLPGQPLFPISYVQLHEIPVSAMYLNEDGAELPNPTPLEPPIGYVKRPSIQEQIRDAIRIASLEALQAGQETFEESEDFDVGDEFDMDRESPWENEFEIDPYMDELLALQSKPPSPPQAPLAKPGSESQSAEPKAAPAAASTPAS